MNKFDLINYPNSLSALHYNLLQTLSLNRADTNKPESLVNENLHIAFYAVSMS